MPLNGVDLAQLVKLTPAVISKRDSSNETGYEKSAYVNRSAAHIAVIHYTQYYCLKNGAKKMGKRGRHEADRGRHEADRGRHEADRGRHEADRGPHEAEQEKTKFLGPQFCRSGIGILRKGEVIP
ncbi:hypothetical protein T06_8565 [Trichinella sp. T6]|nr:hypothetical protein T06_8565 [Trichinella sp. T6]